MTEPRLTEIRLAMPRFVGPGLASKGQLFVLLPALAFAFFGIAAHLLLLAEQRVPSWILIASFALAALCPYVLARRREPSAQQYELRPWHLGVGLILLALVAWSAWTSCATPDRTWDGIVSWGLRAQALGSPSDLSQPFWSAPEVFAHSRTYPLLQPLVLAALGDLVGPLGARVLFPVLYLSILLLVFDTALRVTGSLSWAVVLTLAVAATPAYMDTGSLAIDSGYAGLFVAYAIALAAAGLLREDPLCLFLACLLLPWIKPEGIVYALLLGVVLTLGSNPRTLLAAAVGIGISLLLWLPLRGRLTFSPSAMLAWVGPAVTLLLLVQMALWSRIRGARSRVLWMGGFALLLVVAAVLGRSWLANSNDLMLRAFATNLDQLPERLQSLPALLLGFVGALVSAKTVGLVFLLAVPAILVARGRLDLGSRELWWFLALMLVVFVLALLLSPDTRLEHELRSRLPRLLMHIVPATWIALGASIRVSMARSLRPGETEAISG